MIPLQRILVRLILLWYLLPLFRSAETSASADSRVAALASASSGAESDASSALLFELLLLVLNLPHSLENALLLIE